MPEAFAILAVTAFVSIILIIATLNSANRTPKEKLVELRQRLAWLEEREQQARTRNWDAQMSDNLASQLAETRQAIAALNDSLPAQPDKDRS